MLHISTISFDTVMGCSALFSYPAPPLVGHHVSQRAPHHRQGVWGQGSRAEGPQQLGQCPYLPGGVRNCCRPLQVRLALLLLEQQSNVFRELKRFLELVFRCKMVPLS